MIAVSSDDRTTPPGITVGMPVYNDEDYLRQALDSILAQSFEDFVLVISDDASTDGSAEICREYARRDPRIEVVQQEKNLGISRNMEFLRDRCRSAYFAWVGDDDVWDPHFLERLLETLRARPGAVVAFCTYVFVDSAGLPLGEKRDFDYAGPTAKARLRRLFRRSDDCFGYGLIKADAVRGASFPRWPWPNRDQAYNNIYPSLCHYLVQGDYAHVYGDPLYQKRVKENESQRHNRRAGGGLAELIRFSTRRCYLVLYSFRAIWRAGGLLLAVQALPWLCVSWFFSSVVREWKQAVTGRLVSRG